ncbi:unnamed protein product [Heterobilharzia americana]|nr:unnamed protein product [Heterobilharzia americana]
MVITITSKSQLEVMNSSAVNMPSSLSYTFIHKSQMPIKNEALRMDSYHVEYLCSLSEPLQYTFHVQCFYITDSASILL